MVPIQIATLRNGRLPIPVDADPVIIEIGSSDRNTVDKELLDEPGMEKAFVVSIEPLIEKYARGLSRREKPDKVLDGREPLGQQ